MTGMREIYRRDLGMSSQGIRSGQEHYVRTLLGVTSADQWVVTYWCGDKLDPEDREIEGYFVGRVADSDNFLIDVANRRLHRCFGPALNIARSAYDELEALCDRFDSGAVTGHDAEAFYDLCLAVI